MTISPVRADQIDVGALYRIVGTVQNKGGVTDATLIIPPQMVRVEGKAVFRDVFDVGYIPVTLWSDMGSMGKCCFKTILPLDTVNVPPHGLHDRHLERIPDDIARAFGLLKEENRKDDYTEMVMGRPLRSLKS